MTPSLVALTGPLQGSNFEAREGEFSIGRDSSNWLCITDPLVSRKHCVIKKEDDRHKIIDLESRNGITVNGIPVKERILDHGDQIEIGDSILLFLCSPEERNAVSPIDEEVFLAHSTSTLPLEEAHYLSPKKTLPVTARAVHNLKTLLKISTAIGSIQGIQALQEKLLDLSLEIIPAERAAFFLLEEGTDSFGSCYARDRTGAVQQIRISRTIAEQVLHDSVAVLANDIVQNEKYSEVQSLKLSPIRSLLCVPLATPPKILGLFYMDSGNKNVSFDEEHLQLITAIAGISAVAFENERQRAWLMEENRRLQSDNRIEHNMIGECSAMRAVYDCIKRIASSQSTVLILGESGTGKELAARAIHYNSSCADKPFIAINCASLAETLLESELFGHEKGAFTGAIALKKGKLEVGDGGTVFLDEVSEIAPSLQAKLLRVLQENEFERVGGTRSIKLNVRWIAASNTNLEEAIKAGKFRHDLYYRLNVVSLTMPALKDRREDIPLLASYFLAKHSKKFQRRIKGISTEAREYLVRYDWPGNVRELENAIERAVVLGCTEFILPEDLPEHLLECDFPSGITTAKYHEVVRETKKQIVLKAMEQAGGDTKQAAIILGVHPNYIYQLIRNLNLGQITKR